MIKEIKLPEIADNIDVATVVSIHVSVGDIVSADDSIAEMESDKAVFDLPTDTAGSIKEIKVKEGDEVKVGQVVLLVDTDGAGEEKIANVEETKEPKKEDKDVKTDSIKQEKQEEQVAEIVEPEPEEEEVKASDQPKREVAASPSVRRLARELGVDVHRVVGTGPYERITADDVKAFTKSIIKGKAVTAGVKDDYDLPDFSAY